MTLEWQVEFFSSSLPVSSVFSLDIPEAAEIRKRVIDTKE
jgi:hypothetical protein